DFAEGIEKIARNTSGDRQRKTVRLAVGDSRGCRIAGVQAGIREVEGTTISEITTGKPSVSNGSTGAAQDFGQLFQQLNRPGWATKPPVPRNLGTFSK
ncbi:hypothetical protein GW17_00027589, partial [Ensete ventricosum]